MNLLIALAVSIGINLLMFLIAFLFKTDKLTDISYAATFVVVSLYGFSQTEMNTANFLLFLMVLVWAIRLGGYLLIRINKIGKDKRFDGMRKSFVKFLGFWLLQGFTVWVVLLPVSLFFINQVVRVPFYAYFGFFIWGAGLLVEALSNQQKYNFINNPKNKGKWIETGLWKYSRHPNYFGEIVLWFGVYLYTVFSFDLTHALIGLIGPVYIGVLIIFVSGIPLLEKAADKRWGKDKKYQEYKKRTGILLPNIFSK